jgi:hypothetical protein
LLIPTLICVLAVIGTAALGIASIAGIHADDTQQSAAVEVMSRARDSWIDLARGHAAMYRAINLKAQNVESRLVQAATREALQAIDRAKRGLATLQLSNLPIENELQAKAAKAVGMYGEAAGQAASFVEDDAFTATMSMNDAERKFVAAQQDVSTLTAAAIELESALDERMAALGHSRLVTIGVSASLAVLLSVAASIFLVVSSRARSGE